MGGKNSYESIKKYQDKAYDHLHILLKKGRRDVVKKHADELGMSLNAFINMAIQEKIERMTRSEQQEEHHVL